MTGTPALSAAVTAGLMAVPSWARMMTTFAPFAMSVSTLLAWVVADDLASSESYVPPPAAIAALMAGSSHLAQRGSWKLFHETPTLHAVAAADADALAGAELAGATLAGAELAGAIDAALGLGVAPPEQAVKTIAVAPMSPANRRLNMNSPP